MLVCPYHHRLHHRGIITITGPADALSVTDSDGQPPARGRLRALPATPARGTTMPRAPRRTRRLVVV